MFKIEQEGLAAEEEIHNEPNERETEPPPAFPPEPPAAYEKFRVGRERQQPKRWITTAQFALKVSFWSLGLWGHRAWKYIAHTFLVIVFVFLIIASACFAGPSTFCPISCKYTNLTEKERTFCYQCKFTNIVHAITVTASFLSYLVFAACYVVGKRTTSALVCPPQVLIKETGKPVIFVLFLAFLVMSVLISASLMALPFITAKIYPSIVIEVVLESFSLWVSLNVCHIFASICIVLGRLTDTIGLLY